MEKIEALTTKIDSQFKEIKGEIKEMRDECNKCGGPHPSTEYDDKPMEGPEEEANYHVNTVFTRNGKKYDPPVNPNEKTSIIDNDSEDEADEAEKKEEPSSLKKDKFDPPSLKAYKPKILYPQHLRKEKMEEHYAKFIDMIKEVRINVPLVDVLAGMPNYGKFLKDLVSNKSKMEQISIAFLNEECSTIVQNMLPPKLELNLGVEDDRIIFLIDKAIQHSQSNDNTCFRIYVIDEVTEEELDALLNDSEPFLSMSEKINETFLKKNLKNSWPLMSKKSLNKEEKDNDNL
ncbi:hypothetical protein Tco_1192562 [Tanacetum coccineum]